MEDIVMRKTFKGFIIGVVVTVVLTLQIPVIAESVEVAFNKIKVTVNGQAIQAENVLINGRTYVPLRAISEILNKDVTWDEKTSTAGINDKDFVEKQSKSGYSRNNPAELNTTVKCDFTYGYDENLKGKSYSANITVKEIIRGDAAWEIIKNANQFNDEPKSGYDYLVAKVNFDLLSGADQYSLSGYNFKLIATDGKEYDYTTVVKPEPQLDAKLYAGAKNEGYAVFQVAVTDSKPLITFGRDYNGNGGVWFKAY
jgi:hypothetical protein